MSENTTRIFRMSKTNYCSTTTLEKKKTAVVLETLKNKLKTDDWQLHFFLIRKSSKITAKELKKNAKYKEIKF